MSKAVSDADVKPDAERGQESVLWEWVKTFLYAILLAMFIRTFFLQTFKIPTGSMEPTLRGAMNYGYGDRIIVLKFIYGIPIPFTKYRILPMTEPKRGDVVVFGTKGIEGLDQKKDFIKRIIAVGGERVEIVPKNLFGNEGGSETASGGGHIYVNGQRLEKPASIAERVYYPAGEYGESAIEVPEGHYYMLGDNSLNSRDSRYWGFVPRDNVIGKAVAIYWPPKRMGQVR